MLLSNERKNVRMDEKPQFILHASDHWPMVPKMISYVTLLHTVFQRFDHPHGYLPVTVDCSAAGLSTTFGWTKSPGSKIPREGVSQHEFSFYIREV